jgi:hypothetical protein
MSGVSVTHPELLNLAQTLQLIKDYSGEINTLWSLYAAALSAALVLLTANNWKPRGDLLALAFAVFAVANIYGLYLSFETKRHLVEHAMTMVKGGQPTLEALLKNLRPSPVLSMIILHVVLDAVVLAVILTQTRSARRALPSE